MSPLPLASPSPRRRADARRSLLRESGVACALVAVFAVVAVPTRGTRTDPRVRETLVAAEHALADLRGAIEDHRRDHGVWPGAGRGAAAHAALAADLLEGDRPYLTRVPANPVNGRTDVRIVRSVAADGRAAMTDGGAGWVYDADRGRIWLDATGEVPASAKERGDESKTRWMDL